MRALTNSELVQALLELRQPHAVVEVRTTATCDHEDHDGYVDVPVRRKVTHVRSEANRVVIEVEE